METQPTYSINPHNRLAQDPLGGWLGAALALALAALIVFAAYLVARPVVVNRAANGMAPAAPDASAQGVAGYLAAHHAAGPAELAQAATGPAPAAAVCPSAQDAASASGAPGLPPP